jgi:hypothetical protein
MTQAAVKVGNKIKASKAARLKRAALTHFSGKAMGDHNSKSSKKSPLASLSVTIDRRFKGGKLGG